MRPDSAVLSRNSAASGRAAPARQGHMTRFESSPPLFAPGEIIGECRIAHRAGTGAMGEVYLAEHLRMERPVALKVLLADRLKERGTPVEFLELTRLGHFAMGGYVDAVRQAGRWMWSQWEER